MTTPMRNWNQMYAAQNDAAWKAEQPPTGQSLNVQAWQPTKEDNKYWGPGTFDGKDILDSAMTNPDLVNYQSKIQFTGGFCSGLGFEYGNGFHTTCINLFNDGVIGKRSGNTRDQDISIVTAQGQYQNLTGFDESTPYAQAGRGRPGY